MTWQQWALVVYTVLAAAWEVSRVGSERKVITGGMAAGSVIEYALLVALVVSI